MTPVPGGTVAATRTIALLCAVVATVGGGISITGWLAGIPRLADWLNSGLYMMPNAALCMIMLGMALLLRVGGAVRWASAPALLAAGIGLATLLQHILHVDLGIDRLVIQADWGQYATISPGRMGMPASSMFLIMGTCITLAGGGSRAGTWAARGTVACIIIASLSVIGFAYGAYSFYIIPGLTAISLTTALLALFLCVGLLATLPEVEPMRTLMEPSAAGAMVRRALPLVVLVPVIIGWLRLEGQDAALYDTNFGVALRTILESILLVVLLWWTASAVRRYEYSLRESEKALRESENRYLTFIQHSTEGIWRCEVDGELDISLTGEEQLDRMYAMAYLAECNDAMARMYGYQKGEDLLGIRLADLLPRTPANEAYLREFIRAGYAMHDGESEERDRNGRPMYFSNNLVGIVENGHLIRAWGMQRDITDRKMAAAALLDADRRKDEFLATLAHELRNPLSPLMNAMELLETGPCSNGEMDPGELHTVMRRQLDHMVRLVDDLLDVSRINRGHINLRMETVELAPVLQMAIRATRPLMERSGHTLRVDLTGELVAVHGDAVRLVQVFQNLLNNAARYTPDGGHIHLRMEKKGDVAVITIKDNGIGIAPADQVAIFDMFVQVDRTPARTRSGLGIGLALVKRLVADHGGSVHVSSAGEGKGTTFGVSLPMVAVEVKGLDPLVPQ